MESDCSSCGEKPRRIVRFASYAELILSESDLPATDLERSDILPILDQEIAAVDAAVASMRLTALDPERDGDQDYENTLSPQHRIPPEIWSAIFLYGHHLDSDEDSFDWPTRTIWQLSQVCQTWRNLALSLHSCWSSIILEFPLQWKASEMDVELLAFILERSDRHLLDVTLIDRTLAINSEDLPFQCRMRDMVFAECHRWRLARLVDYHRLHSDELYAPLRRRMPQLTGLDLQFLGCMNDTAVISAFEDCPHLVNVAFTGSHPRMVELPVRQMTSLRLCNLSTQSCAYSVELLDQCPLLKILYVDFAVEHEQALFVQSPNRSLTLPGLRELGATYPLLLDALTLPRLEVAALDRKTTHLHPDTLYSFYSLIQRSTCASNLTKLRIMRVPLTLNRSEPRLLYSILSQTTRLATLQLEVSLRNFEQNMPDEWSITQVMDVMRALEDPVSFLPRLVSLDIEVTGHTDLEDIPYLKPFNDFVCMLRARALEEFSFGLQTCYDGSHRAAPSDHHGTVFDEYESSVLRGLAGDGMSLDIHFEGVLCFDL